MCRPCDGSLLPNSKQSFPETQRKVLMWLDWQAEGAERLRWINPGWLPCCCFCLENTPSSQCSTKSVFYSTSCRKCWNRDIIQTSVSDHKSFSYIQLLFILVVRPAWYNDIISLLSSIVIRCGKWQLGSFFYISPSLVINLWILYLSSNSQVNNFFEQSNVYTCHVVKTNSETCYSERDHTCLLDWSFPPAPSTAQLQSLETPAGTEKEESH